MSTLVQYFSRGGLRARAVACELTSLQRHFSRLPSNGADDGMQPFGSERSQTSTSSNSSSPRTSRAASPVATIGGVSYNLVRTRALSEGERSVVSALRDIIAKDVPVNPSSLGAISSSLGASVASEADVQILLYRCAAALDSNVDGKRLSTCAKWQNTRAEQEGAKHRRAKLTQTNAN